MKSMDTCTCSDSSHATNKAGYTANPVAFGGGEKAVFEVIRAFGQEQSGQRPQKHRKSKV